MTKSGYLSGMTGFARMAGESGQIEWNWEARSVNGKGLDVRLRLPGNLSGIDGAMRKKMSQTFSRGNIQVSFNLRDNGEDKSFRINQALLEELQSVSGSGDMATLLTVPGVVEETRAELSEAAQAEFEAALLKSFDALCLALKDARDAEGAALQPVLSGAISEIDSLVEKASALDACRPDSIKANLEEKLTALLGEQIEEDRLAQEASLLAIKADIREELDRLRAHCAQARQYLKSGSPIGRKLDFLAQEFNRETNTLCSKSSDIHLTQIGLQLKSVIEQFREQAANVE